jgi:hypothetical protein
MKNLPRHDADQAPQPNSPAADAYEPFTVHVGDMSAPAVRVPQDGDAARVLRVLGLHDSQPALFVAGGAGGMQPDEITRTRPLFTDGLARFAEDYDVAVVDGGTDSGVMKLIGDAHRERNSRFPLIGVAPIDAVRFSGHRERDLKLPLLNMGHTHFVFVDGDCFGDESDMLVGLASALARGLSKPLVGLVVNGGEVTRQETYQRALSSRDIQLLVVEGSGRFGDELAGAVRGVAPDDTRITQILANADVHLAPADEGPQRFYAELERLVL